MATTELAAVNQIIGAVGQAPVSSLNSPNPEVGIARSTLQDVNKEVQAEGWGFNSEREYPFAIPTNGEILLSDTLLSITLSRLPENQGIEVTRRNGKLYNKTNHTYVWDRDYPLKCDVVWLFDLADVPEPIVNYIIARAAVITCGKVLGDTDQFRLLKDRENYTRAVALESDLREDRPTMFGWPHGTNPGLPYRPFQVIAR